MNVHQEAQRQFIDGHETAVYTFCHRMIGDPALAETLAQAALVQAWHSCPHGDQPAVLGVAWRLCREMAERPYPADSGYGIAPLLAQLPPTERAATILRHCLHLSDAASAAVLRLPPSTIHHTVRQARTRMAAYVLGHGESPTDAGSWHNPRLAPA
ncbi:MAG: sigma-70 family RNA polymerase sigma factor [Anaerolineales bacterium]|nr:sigma-70 family RNA polymerase sigma factor [Anaerolineales bacterium]